MFHFFRLPLFALVAIFTTLAFTPASNADASAQDIEELRDDISKLPEKGSRLAIFRLISDFVTSQDDITGADVNKFFKGLDGLVPDNISKDDLNHLRSKIKLKIKRLEDAKRLFVLLNTVPSGNVNGNTSP